ncbi:MAG: helix-turn-helix transcriptional regulator [Paracoccaceae bacterium]
MNETTNDWFGPDAATFGDRLAGAREYTGMTQAQMAERLGVELASLQAWEDDLAEPRANRLSMMAGLLNVSMTWLMNGTGAGLDSPQDQTEMSDNTKDILLEIRSIRSDMLSNAEKLARLEKRLRATQLDPAE